MVASRRPRRCDSGKDIATTALNMTSPLRFPKLQEDPIVELEYSGDVARCPLQAPQPDALPSTLAPPPIDDNQGDDHGNDYNG